MAYTLDRCGWMGGVEGWYVLRGGKNWADVEGTASEWLAIAAAVRDRKRESFKRAAVAGAGPGFAVTLWSPRNARGDRDHVELTAAEADDFARHVLDALRAAGEACVATTYDPIHAGG